jgi:hypothetical protein
MITIVNNNDKFNTKLKQKLINVDCFNDILDVQIKLLSDGYECDLLLLDVDYIGEQTDLLIKWITTHNPFVKHIMLYYEKTAPEQKDKWFKILKKEQYKVTALPFAQLYNGLLKYADSTN